MIRLGKRNYQFLFKYALLFLIILLPGGCGTEREMEGCTIEREKWVKALEEDTREAYEAYLEEYPEGQYSREALREITPPVAIINLETTTSTWREDHDPYNIESSVKEALEYAYFEVASEDYDATLIIDYKETKGLQFSEKKWWSPFSKDRYGTRINCLLVLQDTSGEVLFAGDLKASTSDIVSKNVGEDWDTVLYEDAVENFENQLRFAYMGELIAIAAYEQGDPLSLCIDALENDTNHWNVRKEAAEMLGNFPDRRAVEALEKALDDESESVQKAAEEALQKIEQY